MTVRGLALLGLVGLAPACLLAPPRPGEVTGDAGPDGALPACGCVGDADAHLPLALVMPAPGGTTDRLVRAGTCHGQGVLIVHDGDQAGGFAAGFTARCPAQTVALPDPLPDDGSLPLVRAIAPFDASSVVVFVEAAAVTTSSIGQLAVYRVPLDGTPLTVVAAGSSPAPLPDLPAYVATSADPAMLGVGVGGDAWSVALSSGVAVLGAPTRSGSPFFTALAPQHATASAVDTWAIVTTAGDTEADLLLTSVAGVRTYTTCLGCPRIAYADHAPAPAAGDVLTHAISAAGDLSLLVRGNTAAMLRANVGTPDEAEILDAAVRTEAGVTRIALLGDTAVYEGGMVAMATLTLTTSVTTGAWSTLPLGSPLEGPARVLVGRFGGPGPRVVAVSIQPGGPGRRDACAEPSGNALVPCP